MERKKTPKPSMNSPCNRVIEERMGGKNERWKEEWERVQNVVGPPLL
jgi:hypothetical protein